MALSMALDPWVLAEAMSALALDDAVGIGAAEVGVLSSVCADVDAIGLRFSMPEGEARRVGEDGCVTAVDAVPAMVSAAIGAA